MLIEFSVSNFRSIKDRQTLTLVSTSGSELAASNTFPVLSGKLRLLRSLAIYGANASGKTNLIKALQTMQRIVLDSAQQQRGDEVGITPYLFDEATQTQPTEFEIIFLSENVRYQYGFKSTNSIVLEEWLLAYPKGKAQTWIDRKFDESTQQYQWGSSEKLVGARQLWQDATRSNALFLSTAIQLNNKQLQPIFDWFQSLLSFPQSHLALKQLVELTERQPYRTKLAQLLQAADFHISDLQVEPFTSPGAEIDKNNTHPVKSLHKTRQGGKVELDLEDESEGTQKFLAYAAAWFDALENGRILVVDELDNSLHPRLIRFLVQWFHDGELNPKNAQLIFTTHDTSLLSQEVFRRDQIWFTEKDRDNATTLYSLSDFSPRKGVENVEKGYLQGRYGALPYLQTLSRLWGTAA